MSTRILQVLSLFATLFFIQLSFAQSPVTFQFNFCQNGGPATATGYITFDFDEMNNPPDYGGDAPWITLPSPVVLDIGVTVSGSPAGNGTFGLSDFDQVAWDWNGGSPSWNAELYGQPTLQEPWGTADGGDAGDFNLFGVTPDAPFGVWWFTLASGGQGTNSSMLLRNMRQGPAEIGGPNCRLGGDPMPIPAMDNWSRTLLVLMMLALGGLAYRRFT